MSSPSYLQAAAAHGSRSNDKPMHRRVFIGPMPEKVLSQTEAQVRKNLQGRKQPWHHRSRASLNGDEADHDSLSGVIQDHAFQFFLSQGGKEEDWGENEEESVRQEMLKRWKDSEWGSIWKRSKRKVHEPTSRWVGGSFEIGNFLGVNILDEAHTGNSRHSTSSKMPGSSIRPGSSFKPVPSVEPSPYTTQTLSVVPTSTASTVITDPLQLMPTKSPNAVPLLSTASAPGPSALLSPENDHTIGSRRPISDSSTTPLLRPDSGQGPPSKARSEMLRRPIISLSTHSAGNDAGENGISAPTFKRSTFIPRKTKAVHYEDPAMESPPPAPPAEVLARTGNAVQESSAGVIETAVLRDEMVWGDIVMRGWPHSRLLSYSKLRRSSNRPNASQS
jgi:hypothetical protein